MALLKIWEIKLLCCFAELNISDVGEKFERKINIIELNCASLTRKHIIEYINKKAHLRSRNSTYYVK